ncbi:acyloxyacyl hydrolase [Thermophagus xiamenensis]|uniref:Lipid A 3-O-deacylase (PagL) n=1 Tax=Thermophagus xiamenensis TaxID=385682 RepID=A0A1I2EZM4_9BACT|nr:acyloxyacyl hydrolase [Thermophagus xiamenensis]SFE98219.1 Lipid A 3-O-deacylase (PagL) [Thermophagus xiamenensis]
MRRDVLKVIFSLLIFAGNSSVNAQSSLDEVSPNQNHITVLYHQGIVIPHHANMIYFIDDYSRGVEVNYGFLRIDNKGWQQYYNYPEAGVGLFYNSFGNPDIYGQGIALYPYLHFPIVRTPRFSLKNKVAVGIGYTNKPFDYKENPRNQIFGARWNVYVGFGLYAGYRVFDHWSINGSASLNHMSNGALRKPNNGINTLTFSVGARYHFMDDLMPKLSKLEAPRINSRDIQVFVNYGRSQANDYNFNIYSSGSLSINHLWYRSVKSAWSAGLDMIYFGAAPYAYPYNTEYISHIHRMFYGVFGGHHWLMGKTTLFAQVGVYLYSYINPPQPVYPRLGIRHQITDRLLFNFSVKASFFRSEFIEVGLGYRIPYKESTL